MSNDKKYKITVKTIQERILTFNDVIEFNYAADPVLLQFIDVRTGLSKIFPKVNCQIEEVR